MNKVFIGIIIGIGISFLCSWCVATQNQRPWLNAYNQKTSEVLYRGVENRIELEIEGYSDSLVTLVSEDGEVILGKEGYYVKPGKSNFFKLSGYVLQNDSTQIPIQNKKEFRVKRLPVPIAKFGSKRSYDRSIRRDEVSICHGVRSVLVDFEFVTKSTVSSFKLGIIDSDDIYQDLGYSEGNKLTDEMKEILIKKAQKIIITEINADLAGNNYRLSPIVLDVIN